MPGGREIGLQAQNGTKEPPRNGPKTAKNSLPEQHHVEIRGFSAVCKAAGLQRARSTITREKARNGWQPEPEIALRGRPRIAGGYRAEAAHERASKLAAKPRVVRKLVVGSALFLEVVGQLRQGLSPEQIAFTLGSMDEPVRLSMTYDQGREMARHEDLSQRTGLKVYFAHSHSPWERGRNENTNGLLRQYLPKGEDLSGYSQQQLDEIAASLNARPRKSLRWKAPAELFLPKGAFDFKKHWAPSNPINLVALGA